MAKKNQTSDGQAPKATVRPLLVRAGAAYTCFGDGLCCTDIHVLGPLSRKELVQIRTADPEGARQDEEMDDEWVIRTAPDGGCHFLLPDQRCRIHAEAGPEAKPTFCQRFPVGLVATPEGGRVTTHHRCPCRTLGARPALTPESAEPTVSDKRGRPKADRRVRKVRLHRKRKKVSFREWRALESGMLESLDAGTSPEKVLDADPFPELKKHTWEEVADELETAIDGTAFGFATAWFAQIVRFLQDDTHRVRVPPRPWAIAFDRAMQREDDERTEDEVFADWVADEIWSLQWTDDRAFDVFRADLVTRVTIGREIASRLRADHGLRSDRAAAEAVMVVELVGDSEFWTEVVQRIRP